MDIAELEREVVYSVSDFLDDPSIIIDSHYEFAAAAGGLDGLVRGKKDGKDVIVFCETNENLDNCTKPKCTLNSALKYWKKLIEIDFTKVDEYDFEAEIKDYYALDIEHNKECTIWFAFGTMKFKDYTFTKNFKSIPVPWLKVIPNNESKFVTTFGSES